MKILYIITKSEIGGAQTHVLSLMDFLVRGGHEVALMSRPGGWLVDEAQKMGVTFYPNKYLSNAINPFTALKALSHIKKAIKEFSPDLVSLHSSGGGFLGRLAIKGKIPTVFTAHSFAFTPGSPLWRKCIALIAEKMVSKYTDKIICVSEFDRQLALSHHLAPDSKIITIHNGVKSNPLVPKEGSTKMRIISVGRLAYPKKYELLIDVYKNLPQALQDKTELIIIGSGPHEAYLQKYIHDYDLENSVKMVTNAKTEDVFPELTKSDIFILLSKHEGLPMTILEAMSAALPVIASNVGGIPEEIDTTSGIVVENSIEDVTAALKELITNKEKRIAMGVAARKKVEENFSLDKFLQETKKVYDEVLVRTK